MYGFRRPNFQTPPFKQDSDSEKFSTASPFASPFSEDRNGRVFTDYISDFIQKTRLYQLQYKGNIIQYRHLCGFND
jgi:hypothetical protein